MPPRKQPRPPVIGPNLCSLCEQFHVTVGEQARGGVRYCQQCVQTTLGWVQLDADQRTALLSNYRRVAENASVQRLLAELRKSPVDTCRAYAQGEAQLRLMAAARYES